MQGAESVRISRGCAACLVSHSLNLLPLLASLHEVALLGSVGDVSVELGISIASSALPGAPSQPGT